MSPLDPANAPTRITFISHAQTSAVRRAAFPLDEPLLDGEEERIASIKWPTPRAQQVSCGPETRTRETARALGLEPSIHDDLADVDYGRWSGKGLDEIQILDPNGLSDWLNNPDSNPHDGESLTQLIERVSDWQQQVKSGHTLAITHPAVIRVAVLSAMQAPPQSFWRVEVAPLTLTDLRFSGRSWVVRSLGCPL
jgi:broad specificity phosphatase PhoE